MLQSQRPKQVLQKKRRYNDPQRRELHGENYRLKVARSIYRKGLRSCDLEVLGLGCEICKRSFAGKAAHSQIPSFKMKIGIC